MLLFGKVSGNLPDCEKDHPESDEDSIPHYLSDSQYRIGENYIFNLSGFPPGHSPGSPAECKPKEISLAHEHLSTEKTPGTDQYLSGSGIKMTSSNAISGYTGLNSMMKAKTALRQSDYSSKSETAKRK